MARKITFSGVTLKADNQVVTSPVTVINKQIISVSSDGSSGILIDGVAVTSKFIEKKDTNDIVITTGTASTIKECVIYYNQTSTRVGATLSSKSGWGDLSIGSHSVQIVAAAPYWRDSEKSTAVTVTKPEATYSLGIIISSRDNKIAGTTEGQFTISYGEGQSETYNVISNKNYDESRPQIVTTVYKNGSATPVETISSTGTVDRQITTIQFKGTAGLVWDGGFLRVEEKEGTSLNWVALGGRTASVENKNVSFRFSI